LCFGFFADCPFSLDYLTKAIILIHPETFIASNLVPAWSACSDATAHRAVLKCRNGTKTCVRIYITTTRESVMGFERGALLWLLGVPLPIIIILALFMHH
jgi:hypothetical protein